MWPIRQVRKIDHKCESRHSKKLINIKVTLYGRIVYDHAQRVNSLSLLVRMTKLDIILTPINCRIMHLCAERQLN